MPARTAPLVAGENILGADHFLQEDLDDDPVVLVKTGPTILWGYELHNVAGADTFIQCFDAAAIADVTLGTTTPNYVIPVTANGVKERSMTKGVHFKLGLCVASATTTSGNTGAACDVSMDFS